MYNPIIIVTTSDLGFQTFTQSIQKCIDLLVCSISNWSEPFHDR